jgi:hypothetical protein
MEQSENGIDNSSIQYQSMQLNGAMAFFQGSPDRFEHILLFHVVT